MWVTLESSCESSSEASGRAGLHPGKRVSSYEGWRYTSTEFGRQLSIFDEIDYEKLSRMDQTVDGIRDRFGADAVMRAVFLNRPIDHMSGGISREKRSVDYDKVMIW